MIRSRPQKSIMVCLASWYLLVNCLMPLSHQCEGACHTLCHSAGHDKAKPCGQHKDHPAHQTSDYSTPQVIASIQTNVLSHECLACTYLDKSKSLRLSPKAQPAKRVSGNPSDISCTSTCQVFNKPWLTSIILRGPPLTKHWDILLT